MIWVTFNVDCPSGVPVELKGSGNVQSTLKTFTSAVTDTTNTGTTTITTAGDSTLAVQQLGLFLHLQSSFLI